MSGALPSSEIVQTIGWDGRGRPVAFELASGDFAFIGTLATKELEPELPDDAARADYEEIVIVDRPGLMSTKSALPDA
ncbi:MAG TPA: hypothetical protein VLE73_05470 [Candidatus Saccharimonadales bacterium]|nr:hypothetical protein [Candidatus Saccharimonadales bacterium]